MLHKPDFKPLSGIRMNENPLGCSLGVKGRVWDEAVDSDILSSIPL